MSSEIADKSDTRFAYQAASQYPDLDIVCTECRAFVKGSALDAHMREVHFVGVMDDALYFRMMAM